MSVKVMGRVWDADLAPNHKLVLLAYADAAEHDGTQSYPGWDRLGAMTGYSRSTIAEITKALSDLGVLVRVKRGHIGQRAEFQIDLEKLSTYTTDRVSESRTLSNIEPESQTNQGSESGTLPKPERVRSGGVKGSDPPDPSRPDPSSIDLLTTFVDRGRNEVWDTLADLFGDPTTETNRTLRGKVTRSLKAAGASEESIRTRYRAWPLHFSDAVVTETALEKHWDRLGRPPAKASRAEVERFENEMRLAEGELRARRLDGGLPA